MASVQVRVPKYGRVQQIDGSGEDSHAPSLT